MTDYNDGKWHGWNGGECPVHPESLVDVLFVQEIESGHATVIKNACLWDWSHDDVQRYHIIAFRVVTPYIETQEYSGECYAYHYISMAPSLAEYLTDGTIKGRWTATHVNGEVDEITWKRMK